jgi:2-oxoglutarate ferredoxin oxidoreductase subunit alpha
MGQLAAKNVVTNLLPIRTVYPLNVEALDAILGKAKSTLLVEANYSGQLGRLIRAETGRAFPHKLLKYDGEPFYPYEVVAKAVEVLGYGRN